MMNIKYCQWSYPKILINKEKTITIPTTPQAKTECNLLTSLSGLLDGKVATKGLNKTSTNPLEIEIKKVLITKPIYSWCGKIHGVNPYIINPTTDIIGIKITHRFILNFLLKKVNIKSINNCVKNPITISNPSNEYEILYIVFSVKNNSGETHEVAEQIILVI